MNFTYGFVTPKHLYVRRYKYRTPLPLENVSLVKRIRKDSDDDSDSDSLIHPPKIVRISFTGDGNKRCCCGGSWK